MRSTSKTVTLDPGADDDYIAVNQTPSAAGDLTLAKNLTDVNGNVRQLIVTTASDESGKTITIYGRLTQYGPQVTVSFAGPNATTFNPADYFFKIDRIAVSAAFTGNVKVGVTAVGASLPIPVDHYRNPFNIDQVMHDFSSTGSPTFTVQHTNSNIQDRTGNIIPTWFDDATATAKTADFEVALTLSVRAIRLKHDSGTGTATLTLRQAGPSK